MTKVLSDNLKMIFCLRASQLATAVTILLFKTGATGSNKCTQCLKGHKSLNVFVFVFLLVSSCPIITLIKCLKSHKFLGPLFERVL